MLLKFDDGTPFAAGRAACSFGPAENPRLTLEIEVEGLRTTAVLDTGAPFFICNPEIAEQVNFGSSIDEKVLDTRFGKIHGALYRGSIILVAEEGTGVEIEATVFVPKNGPWREAPSFLGLSDCLDRLRFAVEPLSESVYFGKP